MAPAFRFDRQNDRVSDLELDELELDGPADRYRRAPAPGERPRAMQVYRPAAGGAAPAGTGDGRPREARGGRPGDRRDG